MLRYFLLLGATRCISWQQLFPYIRYNLALNEKRKRNNFLVQPCKNSQFFELERDISYMTRNFLALSRLAEEKVVSLLT